MKNSFLVILTLVGIQQINAQFTRRDSLQGGLRIERTSYDVKRYDLNITINLNEEAKSKALSQHNLIVTQFRSISENKLRAEQLQSLVQSLTNTLEVVESSRKEFIETELESISEVPTS